MKPDLHKTIQQKAFEIWEANGQPNDQDLEHWLQAERDVDAGIPKPKRRPRITLSKKSTPKKST